MKFNFCVALGFGLIAVTLQATYSKREFTETHRDWDQEYVDTLLSLGRAIERIDIAVKEIDDIKLSKAKSFSKISKIINSHADVISLKSTLEKDWKFWKNSKLQRCQELYDTKVRTIIQNMNKAMRAAFKRIIKPLESRLADISLDFNIIEKSLVSHGPEFKVECSENIDSCVILRNRNFIENELQFLRGALKTLPLDDFRTRFNRETERKIRDSLIPAVYECLEQ